MPLSHSFVSLLSNDGYRLRTSQISAGTRAPRSPKRSIGTSFGPSCSPAPWPWTGSSRALRSRPQMDSHSVGHAAREAMSVDGTWPLSWWAILGLNQ